MKMREDDNMPEEFEDEDDLDLDALDDPDEE